MAESWMEFVLFYCLGWYQTPGIIVYSLGFSQKDVQNPLCEKGKVVTKPTDTKEKIELTPSQDGESSPWAA